MHKVGRKSVNVVSALPSQLIYPAPSVGHNNSNFAVLVQTWYFTSCIFICLPKLGDSRTHATLLLRKYCLYFIKKLRTDYLLSNRIFFFLKLMTWVKFSEGRLDVLNVVVIQNFV